VWAAPPTAARRRRSDDAAGPAAWARRVGRCGKNEKRLGRLAPKCNREMARRFYSFMVKYFIYSTKGKSKTDPKL
jgi:hypothetical protein